MKKKNIILGSLFLLTASCQTQDLQTEARQMASVTSQKPRFLPGFTRLFPAAGRYKVPGSAALAPEISPIYYGRMDEQNFQETATFSEGFIKGAVVKFLIDRRSNNTPAVYFINGNYKEANGRSPEYVQYHYYFAQHQLDIKDSLEEFNQHTYFTNDLAQKTFIAGTLQKYEILKAGKTETFFGIQFYPQDVISEETLALAIGLVKDKIEMAETPLKFVASGAQQTYGRIAGPLQHMNVTPMSLDQIYAGISFVPMQEGTTYGVVKYLPTKDQLANLAPTDIPVFNELPLDLSVVSGVITTVIQDAGSHVNLKSKERNTPNMVLRDPDAVKRLQAMNGKPVKLTVTDENYELSDKDTNGKPLSLKAVQAFYQNKLKNKPRVQVKTGTAQEMISFDQAATRATPQQLVESASSYGGKASKLAFLAHRQIAGLGSSIQKQLNYRVTPIGFGIPAYWYLEFLKSNPALGPKIQKLANAEKGKSAPLAPVARAQLINDLQKEFLKTPVPAAMVAQLQSQIENMRREVLNNYPKSPLTKIKIRSSANAEDIQNFDGAGLHSSYSAKVDQFGKPDEVCEVEIETDKKGVVTKEEMSPKTVLCAVKGVYASLWNRRAVDERSYARIDQDTAAMGIAVNNAYDFRAKTEAINEIANAVLVTRIINAKGVYGYRLSVNTDENLVTNPTPGTQAEVVLATFTDSTETPRFSFLQYAKTDALTEALSRPLLSDAVYRRMIQVAQAVELNYCRTVPSYYPNGDCSWVAGDQDKAHSLDMEFKIYSNGEVILKQTREFSGR